MNYEELIEQAKEAQKRAYVPYSRFPVGAALLTKDSRLYLGANIENAAYSPTCCAERTAIVKAVFDGHLEFKAIAVVGDTEDYCMPCGVCRQVFVEFSPEMDVIAANREGSYRIFKAKDLLPGYFSAKELE